MGYVSIEGNLQNEITTELGHKNLSRKFQNSWGNKDLFGSHFEHTFKYFKKYFTYFLPTSI